MLVIKMLNNILRLVGAEIVRYPNKENYRRKIFLESNHISLVLDVGANIGKYSKSLRENGYRKKIISFEPLSQAYLKLEQTASKDKDWTPLNFALGSSDEELEINVSENLDSSSILSMLPSHLKSAPESKFIGKEKIKIKKLDSIFNDYCEVKDKIYLKIDTQGFEKHVLNGALKSITKIFAIQIELSLVQLYEASPTYLEIIEFMSKNNFELCGVEPGFSDYQNGRVLQFDGLFYNTALYANE